VLLIVLLLGMILLSLPELAYSQPKKEDFFYSNGQKSPVVISLTSIGILAKDGVSTKQIDTLADMLNLAIIREFPGGIFVLALEDTLSKAGLVTYAREIRDRQAEIVVQSGLVVTLVGEEAPLILTDEFIAKFKSNVTKAQVDELNETYGVEIISKNPHVENQFLLRISAASKMDALQMANRYHENALVEFSHPNFIAVLELYFIPNDPHFGDQWHLRNSGQGGGTVDADIDADLAWDITSGTGVLIAVIDEGFDWNHPDLAPNRWVNTGEIPGNNNDDDGNGYADDVNGGWDFFGHDNDPAFGSHGTAVAGVAGARGNNAFGVSGSCPGCTLMFIRWGYSDNDMASCFDYARTNGADIITNSWGYNSPSYLPTVVATAVDNATKAGIVVLFAAGNIDANICSGIHHKRLNSRANVITVSSSSNQDRKVVVAGFGNCVDILAPSHRGYQSTDPFTGTLCVTTTDRPGVAGYNNAGPPPFDLTGLTETTDRDYTNFFGGTSSATPLTAGVVGLILSVNPNLTREQIQRLLQDTADKIEPGVAAYADNTGFSSPATGTATHSWGRLNAFEAVRIAAPKSAGGKEGVDIFLRDNSLDWGNTEQPSNTLFESTRGVIGHWQSMDIKVDAPPYQVAPTAATFDAFTDETPSAIPGNMNRVYVRVRNRGPVTDPELLVKVFWTQFGTALPPLPSDFWAVWPSNSANTSQWHPLDCAATGASTCTIRNLAYSGSSVAGTPADAAQIVQFDFPAPGYNPALPNHFCLLAMVDSWRDTILPKTRLTPLPSDFVVDILTPTDNNVSHRNYTNLPTGMTTIFVPRFFVRNPIAHQIGITLDLDAPDGWRISLDTLGFNRPISLEPQQEVLVTMEATLPKPNLSGEVTITQMRTDVQPPEVMGGVTYGFSSVPDVRPPYPFSFSIHGGTAIPVGTLADDFKTSYNLLADIDYHFSPRLAIIGLFGYNAFKSKTTGIDDTYWINLSLNLRYYWPLQLLPGPLSVYIGAGPGIYIPKDGDVEFGANAGCGFTYPFRPNIHLEVGADYHWIFDPDIQFTHSHAGLVFRF
jgi:subtilisin family serine protease